LLPLNALTSRLQEQMNHVLSEISVLLVSCLHACASLQAGQEAITSEVSLGSHLMKRIRVKNSHMAKTLDETSLIQSRLQIERRTPPLHEQKIPRQLILTGKWASLADVKGPVAKNLLNTMALNPELHVRWFSDATCQNYLSEYYDKRLADIFAGEGRGSFRGDICRAAVLAREGGFYTDLDVQWVSPMRQLANASTTFMSAYDGEGHLLNAVMAAEPKSKIMVDALQEIRKWYVWDPNKNAYQSEKSNIGWMGPVTLMKALRDVQQESCPEAVLEAGTAHSLDTTCGDHSLRFYDQRLLHCHSHASPTLECPAHRASSHFDGLNYGLFEPARGGKLIGWPRFSECDHWGCGGGGWDVTQPTKIDANI